MNKLDYGIKVIDLITETPDMRAERLEEARIEDLEYEEECRNDRSEYEQKKYDSGTKDGDFL